MANKWLGRIPQLASMMSPRLFYAAIGLAILGVCAVIYGFHYRIEKKRRLQASVSAQVMASDAATSNRTAVHSESFPGTTLASNLGATLPSPPPLVVGKVIKPHNAVWNCPPLPNGQADPNCETQPSNAPRPVAEIDPATKMRLESEERLRTLRMAALDAPTGTSQSGPTSLPTINPIDQLQANLARLRSLPTTPAASPVATGASPLGRLGADEDQNQQAQKRAFQKTSEGDYLKTTRMPPISPWVVERGEVIPAGLPSQIVSDLPGDLVAEVKRDVYDTPTHRVVLIPAGSLLAGEYNSGVTYGQKRIQVIWSYLRFPDGSFVDLDKFVGHGADGSTGLSDQVDNHLKRLMGGVALSSLFAAGLEISQNRTTGNSTLAYPSNTQLAASAAGLQAAELGQQITSRNLNVQPTVKIRPGDIFYVSVMKSIIFPGPYKPLVGSR